MVLSGCNLSRILQDDFNCEVNCNDCELRIHSQVARFKDTMNKLLCPCM